MLDHEVCLVSILLDIAKLLPKRLYQFTLTNTVYKSSHFLPARLLNFCQANGYETVSHLLLKYSDFNIEHLFIYKPVFSVLSTNLHPTARLTILY